VNPCSWMRTGIRVTFSKAAGEMSRVPRKRIRRGTDVRTTSGKDANRAADLVNRQFRAPQPNRVWVADFPYVRTWPGFAMSRSSLTCSPNASPPGTPPPTSGPT
jgi:transposase InsO family protein